MVDQVPPKLTAEHALFLDFDGTLVEIAATPDAVVVREGLTDTLGGLHELLGGALAIVSGRQLDDVASYLSPLELPGSGSHGLERRRSDGSMDTPGDRVSAEARAITEAMRARFGDVPGMIIEAKDWSPSLHYRGAPDREAEARSAMQAAIADLPDWTVKFGKMVVETRYAGFSKETAVEAFMAEAPFKGRVPVFIGDDVTDEDGMQAAIAHGGFGIKVGPGETVAAHRLEDPVAVLRYLSGSARA